MDDREITSLRNAAEDSGKPQGHKWQISGTGDWVMLIGKSADVVNNNNNNKL